MYLKYSLGMHRTASNFAIIGETATHPLYIKAIAATIKYYKRLINPEAPTLMKHILLEQKALHDQGHPCWLTNVNKYIDQLGGLNIDIVTNSAATINATFKNKYAQWWEAQIPNIQGEGHKLRTYVKFKHQFGFESYLDSTNIRVRNANAKFRISHHKLHIETDRRIRNVHIPPQLRLCQMCEEHVMEDEYHVFKCSAYQSPRKEFNIPQYVDTLQFVDLMHNNSVNTQLYIFKSMEIRASKNGRFIP